MKKWRDKITYKGKVLIGLFLVSVLPIGVLGGYSYGVLYNAMHTRMDYVAEAEIEEINETVDGILGNIRSYYLDRIAAEPIVNMINESMGYSQYTIQVEAMKVLQGGSYLNRYINGYSFINMKTDWVLSDRGMYYFTESDNQTELKELMKGSEYRTAYIVNASPDFIPMPHGTINISGMFFLFKLPNATPNTQCILIVNLNKNEIYDHMNKLADYEITVLDGQNRLVMGTDDELAAYIVEHAEELENKKQLKLSSQKSVSFRMLQSDNEELSYIITYDNSIINRESNRIITMMYEQRISIMERRYYLQRAFLGILEVLEDAGLRISEIFSENEEDMFLRFQHLYEMEDMKHFFKEKIVLPAIEVLKQSRMVNGKNIKERVLELIRKSRGDITLMECADKLNYNSNYLGRVLHCESNSSFSAYVAEIKVEYAKELLMKTEMTVADISTYLNYSNSQNFIRFFQKHVGMSPAKYRIHVRENQSE